MFSPKALQYGMRDFLQSWFHVWVSPNPAFPDQVQSAIVVIVHNLTKRSEHQHTHTLTTHTHTHHSHSPLTTHTHTLTTHPHHSHSPTRCSEADLATLLSQTLLEESLSHIHYCKDATSGSTDSDAGFWNFFRDDVTITSLFCR